MRATPEPPTHPSGDVYPLDATWLAAWRSGWKAGYKAALQAVTTVQQELPTEDPW